MSCTMQSIVADLHVCAVMLTTGAVIALSKVCPHAKVGALQLQAAAAPPHRRCAAKHMRRG
eukprot:6185428-Pleurochrysis_carterae.AAC.1